MSQNKKLWATVALLLTAAIWGSGFVFLDVAIEELSTSFIVASRFSIAAILIIIATFKKLHLLERGYFIGGLVSGTTLVMGNGLQTLGMVYGTTPGKSAFLTAAYCVIVPFLCWIFMKERPKKNHILSAIICLVGIGLISFDGEFSMMIGDVATLGCSVAFAGNIISLAYYCRGRDPMLLTMVQICVSAIWGWIAVFITGGMPEHITSVAVGNIFYLAVFATALCLSLQTIGLKYINATVGTVILTLESVFGVIFAVLFCGEQVTLKIALGFAVIFFAVIFAQLDFTNPKGEIS